MKFDRAFILVRSTVTSEGEMMAIDVVTTVDQVRRFVAEAKQAGRKIGFVPTMGALHEGHAALIDASVRAGDWTVVSIFVNPLQFGPSEDLDRYPRNLAADQAVCEAHGASLIFAPPVVEMYPAGDPKTTIEVHGLTDGLCGAHRPGHFRGVTTVVGKLFNIVQPDRAYFGQKDFQQLVVIKRMVQDLNFPIEIVPVATVREPDGLAKSSRNSYLSPEEREAAAGIYRALSKAAGAARGGERDPERLKALIRSEWSKEPLIREEYIEIVDAADLTPITRGTAGRSIKDQQSLTAGEQSLTGQALTGEVLIAVACRIGSTRLIDNVVVDFNAS